MNKHSHSSLPILTITLSLFSVDFILALLHLFLSNHAHFGAFFNLSQEANLPTWYSSFKLTLAALAAFYCYRIEAHKKHAWLWLVVALLMLLMSIDETAQIHETLSVWFMNSLAGNRLRIAFEIGAAGGPLLWGIIFAPILILLAGGLLSFYYHRFQNHLNYLWLAGIAILLLFLSFLLEQNQANIAGQISNIKLDDIQRYKIMSLFEELCELMAINFFLLIHLAYIQQARFQKIR